MQRPKGVTFKGSGIFLLAAAIGGACGLLGVAFFSAIKHLQELFMGDDGSVVTAGMSLSWWGRLLVPTLGGLLAGLVLLTIRSQRGPFGVSDVIELVTTRRGRIKTSHSLVQILSSALTIASGGSIGREGANSQFGATVSSILGRLFHASSRNRAMLLGCGVAAGMAFAYKAPIAGALFVMEVVLGNFAMDVLAPIVVASVTSTLVAKAYVDYAPLYAAAPDQVRIDQWYLVLSAMLLGALCGFGGVVFRKSLELGQAAFRKLRLPLPLSMAVGGLCVGVIGVWYPETWGNGQSIIESITGNAEFTLIATLLVLKIVATSATAGSGGLGGVFTPTLVVGAALGAAFAEVIDWIDPSDANHRISFALVGMAGLCASTTHAPITAIILVFELTGDYALILPLMLCAMTGSIAARMFDPDSIYTARLRAKGHTVHEGIEQLAIHSNYVRDIQRIDPVSLHHHTKFATILQRFNESRRGAIYAVDDEERLLGQIQLHDVKQFINDSTLGSVVIAADLTRPVPHVTETESLAKIINRFDDPDIEELPVVADEGSKRLTGRVTRRDLVTCLSEEVLGQRNLRAKLRSPNSQEASFVELPPSTELAAIEIPVELAGRALDSLEFHENWSVTPLIYVHTSADGKETRSLAHPNTLLEPGSRVIVLGEESAVAACRESIRGT